MTGHKRQLPSPIDKAGRVLISVTKGQWLGYTSTEIMKSDRASKSMWLERRPSHVLTVGGESNLWGAGLRVGGQKG